MEIKKSDLILLDFNILNFNFRTDINFEGVPDFHIYKVDMEFKILNNKINDFEFLNILALNINFDETKLPGYSFSLLASGKFNILNFEKHTETEKTNLIFRSTLPIMIANSRAFLANATAFGKFGKYYLPSVDILHFLNNYKLDKSKIKITKKPNITAFEKSKKRNKKNK